MRVLKLICILLCVRSLFSAFTGSHSVLGSQNDTLFTKHDGVFRCYAFVKALIFAVTFYGIQKKLSVGWKLGWLIFAIIFIDFLAQALSSSLNLPQSDFWLALTAQGIGGSGVALFWGFWWRRQKPYFVSLSKSTAEYQNLRNQSE
jgi:hypothetical protein